MKTFNYDTALSLDAGGELRVNVQVEYSPKESRTFDDPGCPESACIEYIHVYKDGGQLIDLADLMDIKDVSDSVLEEFWEKFSNDEFNYEGDY